MTATIVEKTELTKSLLALKGVQKRSKKEDMVHICGGRGVLNVES